MAKQQFGVLGLAVMGQNLALNIANKGFSVAVFNRTAERTERFIVGPAAGKDITGTYSHEEFCRSLDAPRRIMLMVKSGAPVDDQIALLKPHLDAGDILIDGGNSYFKDTERRVVEQEADGFLYIGTGVSGGEEGALHGPSIMPGGHKEAYAACQDVLTAPAAPTSAHAAPATTSRWSTTASSTA